MHLIKIPLCPITTFIRIHLTVFFSVYIRSSIFRLYNSEQKFNNWEKIINNKMKEIIPKTIAAPPENI